MTEQAPSKQGELLPEDIALLKLLNSQCIFLGVNHIETLNTKCKWAHRLNKLGRYAEAESEFRELLKTLQNDLGKTHMFTLYVASGLANVISALGQHNEAYTLLKEISLLNELREHADILVSKQLLNLP